MGERKGTNKYYPPDFDPKKHGSLAGYTGQHPLRERARKIKQGILIIRFEMPYNIWCDGCNEHIGMGVRYNAEKSKVGNYYTTPIYKFRMKCHLCDNHFEIKTDPANHDYVIISGARRKEQRWDPKENEQIVPEDRATQKKLALDAMYKLEHGVTDKATQKAALPGIAELEDQKNKFKDDYMLNKMLRSKFRDEKKSLQKYAASDADLLKKSSLDIHLVKEDESDKKLAGLLKYSTVKSYDEQQKEKREAIESRPIFDAGSGSSQLMSNVPLADIKKKVSAAEGLKRNKAFTSVGKSTLSASSLGIIRNSKKATINKGTIPPTNCNKNEENSSRNVCDLDKKDETAEKNVSCFQSNKQAIQNSDNTNQLDIDTESDKSASKCGKSQNIESEKSAIQNLSLIYDSSSSEDSRSNL